LFDFAPIQKILWNEKNRATFQNAEISGSVFLERGDIYDFWFHRCGLPIGPSAGLAGLAQKIKYMDEQESPGNAFHFSSDKPANTFTVQSPLPPHSSTKDFERLKFLHGLLWGQEECLGRTVFCDFQHPSWNRDTNPHINNDDTSTAVKLSLSDISSGEECLPCGASELLVRKPYEEMYDILLQAQKVRMKSSEEGRIPNREKIILILGQPGIGKTWFLSYVLVRRLLEGKPIIFQVASNRGGNSRLNAVTHYLIDGNGVRELEERLPLFQLKNSDIWVLADQTPFGKPRSLTEHNWLVVVTSSPRVANYKYIVKECSPERYYLPTWDWDEVVAAT
jgi:hypothetical protein